uniref:UMA domain-containing protein n=1 Tax=Anopheles minimus TaxID=112268 RepID=A0A182W4L6_9DIPT
MFSFFKSKKPSPTQIPSDPIPGAGPAPLDDFIFIERRGQQPADDGSRTGTPTVGTPSGGGIYPNVPEPPTTGEIAVNPVPVRQRSDEKVCHALNGVPFRLSADIGQPSDMEITRIQANEILAYIARVMYAPDYDFSLERSVLQD